MASVVGPLAIIAVAKMCRKAIFFLWSEQAVHLAMEKGLTELADLAAPSSTCWKRCRIRQQLLVVLADEESVVSDPEAINAYYMALTDCETFARVLASRLVSVPDNMIYPDQSYTVRGQRIHDNIHMVRDWTLPVFYQDLITVWDMVDLHQAYPTSGVEAITRQTLLRNPHLHNRRFQWLSEGEGCGCGGDQSQGRAGWWVPGLDAATGIGTQGRGRRPSRGEQAGQGNLLMGLLLGLAKPAINRSWQLQLFCSYIGARVSLEG
eukprot:g43173.t1